MHVVLDHFGNPQIPNALCSLGYHRQRKLVSNFAGKNSIGSLIILLNGQTGAVCELADLMRDAAEQKPLQVAHTPAAQRNEIRLHTLR